MNNDLAAKAQRALRRAERRSHAQKALVRARGFRQHANEPVHNVRQAKVIAHMLANYPVVIGDDELLVGRYSTDPLSQPDQEELDEAEEFVQRYAQGLRWGPGSGGTGGHRTVDFERVLRDGVEGILCEIAAREAEIDYSAAEDGERAQFYSASRIALRGLLRFAERYRNALADRSRHTDDPQVASHLESLADMLAHVPARPARTFHEALQAVWFVQFALSLADDTSCTGRPDDYLWPYYEQDLASGGITRERALRLVEELYLRSNEAYGEWPETLMVGGINRKGRAVLNDLSRLFVEAIETVALVNPNVGLCYRPEMPDEFLLFCLQKIARGYSHPAFYNDRIITEGLKQAGLSAEDARYYINSTCVEITPIGCSNVQVAAVNLYPAKALQLLVNGGREVLPDNSYLPGEVSEAERERWPEPFEEGGLRFAAEELSSWEEFQEAYFGVLARLIRQLVETKVHWSYRLAHYGSSPLVSCFTRDCIERGRDAAAGGARANYLGTMAVGFSTAVDSLLAVREAVYRRHEASLEELAEALRRDFQGYEDLRQFVMTECPRYGYDDSDADALAAELYTFMADELARYRTHLGGRFYLGVFSGWGGRPHGAHVNRGMVTGATPNGRRAGQPLSECMAPAQGSDRKGLTALANSVTKMDHRRGLGGIAVNCRLSPRMMKTQQGRQKLLAWLREFMRKGVFEVQFNVVDSETLRAARRDPEAYRTLTVRIAGYSDYFCGLDDKLQDEIIERTEHELA